MLKSIFQDTFDGMRGENKFLRIAVLGLMALMVVQFWSTATKEQVVAIVPPTMTEKGWVSETDSSGTYSDAWVLYVAMMLGNVTPDNAEVVKSAIGPILHPEIYQNVMTVLADQIQSIRKDRVSMAFQPDKVLRDSEKRNRFYVTGRAVTEGPTGDKSRTARTYEIELAIKDFKPVIEWISTYAGAPRTSDVLARERAVEERRQRAE